MKAGRFIPFRLSPRTLLSASALLALFALTASAYNAGFVSIHDGQFWVEDRPFTYAGTNTYYLMVYSAILPGEDSLRPYVHEAMGEAAAMKLTVVRTWAFNDGAGQWHALQTAPGAYDEYVLQGLDYVLYRANLLNLRVILTLVNNWNDYGGMNQYVDWSPTASVHDQFYTDANCRAYYKDHVSRVLNRVNTFNSRTYKDDPTILAWELANEPHCASDLSGNTLDAWVTEMSAYVKSIDSKHLVTVGTESNGTDGQDFLRNYGHSAVDFAGLHLWPDWWGWNLTTSNNFLIQLIGSSHRTLVKPLILGEFGKHRPLTTRDTYYSQFYSTMNTYNAAGTNFWMLAHNDYFTYDDGFQVQYPADASTVTIINGQSAEARGRSAVAHAFADAVDSSLQGDEGGQGDPSHALGFPDDRTWSMGRGGRIILRFDDNYLIDGPGNDLVVYEDSILQGSGGIPEHATVSISTDGVGYTGLGVADGTTAFDIGSSALNGNAYRYVKIEDDGDFSGELGVEYQGFDINAVRCLHTKRMDFTKPVRVEAGADVVVVKVPGTGAGANDPRNVLGLPGGPSWSLGTSGSITLKFVDNVIVNRDGPDFIVYEGALRPGDSGVAESAYVSVSQDGSIFQYLGVAYGTTAFDIAPSGLATVRYVKIDDDGGGGDDNPSGGHAGYDLDAVCATHGRSAIRADFSRDGVVDFNDLTIFAAAYDSRSGQPRYNPEVDMNDDGVVDFRDIGPFSGRYGTIVEDYSRTDINGDGCVTNSDLTILNAALGSTTIDEAWNAAADLNDDSVVDSADQQILTSQLGTCPGQ